MKKTLILASILAFSMTSAIAAETTEPTVPEAPQSAIETQKPDFQKAPPKKPDLKKDQFEKRMNLSDKQKAKAKELRDKSREDMKPIMEQINAKHQEAEAIRKIESEDQRAKLDKINTELRDLDKQAQELRTKNMKDFEKILNKKQKKELNQMKQEGRKQFERDHRRPGGSGQGFGPGFGQGFGHGPQMPSQRPGR